MATHYVRNKTRYVNWTDASGQRQRHPIGSVELISESDAEAACKAIEFELATGNPVLGLTTRRSTAPSWETFVERYNEWYEQQYPDNHWRVVWIIDKQFTPFFGLRRQIDGVTPELVEAWLKQRRASPGTMGLEVRTLKAMMSKAVEWKLLPYNPLTGVKAPRDLTSRPKEFYTTEDLQALYAASSGWHTAAWKLFANTGLRRNEAQHLRWTDVTDKAITVRSEKEARTKSGRWRHVPLGPGALEALRILRQDTRSTVLPVVTSDTITRQFQRDARRAGLKGNLHLLRHTFVSHMLMSGRSLFEVGRIVGHSNEYMTEHYAHLTPDYLQSAVQGMNL